MGDLKYQNCFVCGQENVYGMQIKILDGEFQAQALWTAESRFCGYDNILHGGILTAIMDDLMVHAVHFMGADVVTAHIEADFKVSVHAGDCIRAEAYLIEKGTGRSIKMGCRIFCGDEVVAEGNGVLVIV